MVSARKASYRHFPLSISHSVHVMHNSSGERRRVPLLRDAFYRFKKKKVRKRVLTSPGINHISLCRPTVLLIEQKEGLLTSSSDPMCAVTVVILMQSDT